MVTRFLKIKKCMEQSLTEVSTLKIAHGPVTLLAVFHFLPLSTLWSSKYNKNISTVYIKVKPWYSIPPPPLLSAHESLNRNSLLYSLQIYCHPPYTATHCSEQTVVLYRDLIAIFCMKLYKISCCVERKKRFDINLFFSSGYNYKCLFIMKVMGAFYVCNGILVDEVTWTQNLLLCAFGIWTGFPCGFLIQQVYWFLILCCSTVEHIKEHCCEELCHLIMQYT
jgi:hypothetical protein